MDENNNQEMQTLKEPTKKEKAEQAGKDVAEIAAKGLGTYFGGSAGGALADKIARTKMGKKILGQAGKKLAKNPFTRNVLAKAQPAIQNAKPMLNAAVGSSGANGISNTANPKSNNYQQKNISDKTSLPENQNNNDRQSLHPVETTKIVENQKTKKWIIGVVISCLPFILCILLLIIFVVIISGDIDEDDNSYSEIVNSNEQVTVSSSGAYWWPIGGSEVEVIDGIKYATGTPTSTVITSSFSNSRTINGATTSHKGIDIDYNGHNLNYIIASKSGDVYKSYNGCPTNGYDGSSCGDGYGNYVVLKHSDGNYTIYAHMAENTITVSDGDTVKQGQIIGEMGSSGSSTVTYLYFQIDVGAYSNDNAVDPLTYVDPSNPQPKGVSSKLLSMLHLFEGSGPTSGDYYIAYHGSADASGIITIGHGVVIKYNVDKFKARGYSNPVSQITTGTKVLKSIVDEIEMEILNERRNNIVNKLNNRSISLYEYQIDALVCRDYNVGNINNFYDAYKKYGATQDLYDNYMSKPVTANGKYVSGLEKRRQREWKLFTEGLYYGVDYT